MFAFRECRFCRQISTGDDTANGSLSQHPCSFRRNEGLRAQNCRPISKLEPLMHRLPYSLRRAIVVEDGFLLQLNLASDPLDTHRISKRFAAFILANSNCRRCGQRMRDFESHVQCPERNHPWAQLEPLIPKTRENEFHHYWDQHMFSAKSAVRQARLKEGGGSHTHKQLRKLMVYQEGRCYYCYVELASHQRQPVAQRDHFVPVYAGGTSNIGNIVYACPTCNIEKGASNGESFRAKKLRKAPPEIRMHMQRIHRAVASGQF